MRCYAKSCHWILANPLSANLQVFNFTVGVKVEQHSQPLGKAEQDMTKLCNHRRKVVAMAALCRSMQASQLPFANLHYPGKFYCIETCSSCTCVGWGGGGCLFSRLVRVVWAGVRAVNQTLFNQTNGPRVVSFWFQKVPWSSSFMVWKKINQPQDCMMADMWF